MALLGDDDPTERADWKAWVAERAHLPLLVEATKRMPPGRLYRDTETNLRGFPIAYSEDGTVRVAFTGEYNLITFERQVFGIDPGRFVECDLPLDDEPLGVVLTTHEEIEGFIAKAIPEGCSDPRCSCSKLPSS